MEPVFPPNPDDPVPLHEAFREATVLEYLGILWPALSRVALEQLFARGRLRAGGTPVSPRRIVGELSDLRLHGALVEADCVPGTFPGGRVKPPPESCRVLHEDERWAVLEKPAEIPVGPDRDRQMDSCLAFLIRRELAARGTKAPQEYVRPRLVHRLDRLTTGVVLVAKTAAVERRLRADFEARRVEKEYRVIVRGVVEPARLTVNCPVVPGRKGRMRAVVANVAEEPGARKGTDPLKEAVTRFDVLERFSAATYLLAKPFTGRTHQIRVHAWAAGHPLLHDPVYGTRGDGRLSLHALRYGLPTTWEEPRVFECPLRKAFEGWLEELRRGEG